MEASGTPTPQPDPPQSPPPPAPPGAGDTEDRAGGGWRALGVVLALALAFACAVMVIAMADIGETATCDDPQGIIESGKNECFDGSSGQKTASLILGWPSGVLAGIAALIALYFAATGRRGQTLLQLTGAAIVLGALSILIGSI